MPSSSLTPTATAFTAVTTSTTPAFTLDAASRSSATAGPLSLRGRRRFLILALGSTAALGACRSRSPLVQLDRVAVLPVRSPLTYTIDERDIISRQRPPARASVGAGTRPPVQELGTGVVKIFHETITTLNPAFAARLQAAVIQDLTSRGLKVVTLSDSAAADQARQKRGITSLASDVDAYVDLTISALGYRASFSKGAYTPEIYVELDVLGRDGGSIDGALYTYDVRPSNGDPRQVQAPDEQLFQDPGELSRQGPTVVANLNSGLDRIAALVANDVGTLARAQALG